jgi:hypothetical protein
MLSFYPPSRDKPYEKAVSRGFRHVDASVETMRRIIETFTWSPIIWADGHRTKGNFLYADFYALDYDKPADDEGNDLNIEVIRRRFCDCWFMIGITRSHQKWKKDLNGNDRDPPCDRFRLLLKAERRITSCEEYEFNIRKIVNDTGADPQAIDGAHYFYRCDEIILENIEDDALRWEVLAPPTEEERRERLRKYEARNRTRKLSGQLPTHSTRFLTTVFPGNSLHKPRFNLACELARAGVSFDDAMHRLLMSPNYKDKEITPKLLEELERVMRDGYDRVARDAINENSPDESRG